jgi:hypothetical protein
VLSHAARVRFGLDGKARATSMSAATCEEQATPPDSPKRARPPGCIAFHLSSVARRSQTASGILPPRALERRKIGSNAAWLSTSTGS